MGTLERKLHEAKRKVRRAAQTVKAARARASEGQTSDGTVNTDVRYNVEVRINTDSDGSAQEASAVQYAPIHQGRGSD